ncbi:MAG: heparinase II/III family protein, partial [Deltaproteobacteria bacterium]|nr:heparinase II/III family protein [Deltaproteobacteria bacterium]
MIVSCTDFRRFSTILLFVSSCAGAGDELSPEDIPDFHDEAAQAEVVEVLEEYDDQKLSDVEHGEEQFDIADELETSDIAFDEEIAPCAGLDKLSDKDNDGLSDFDECVYGTDSSNPDTDSDGISDGKEVSDGTGPADPSSATAWHPELADVHPRLFFDIEEIEELSARTQAVEGPYAILWKRIIVTCAKVPPQQPADGTYSISAAREQGLIAQACAFQSLLAPDADSAIKAADLLAAPFPDPSYINDNPENPFMPLEKYDLLESEALAAFCSAWDFLASQGDLIGADQISAAEAGLLNRIETFRKMIHEGATYFLLAASENNHSMKVFGALGLCAMALNDRPTAAYDLSESYGGLDFVFARYQSVPEGGYAEGWNYLVYGSMSYLQFIVAHHRYSEGEAKPYKNPGTLTLLDELNGKTALYEDFAVNETIEAVYRMALYSAFPDGTTVNTDDANPARLHGAVLAWLYNDNRFLWNWQMPAVNYFSSMMDELSFVLYDQNEEPEIPSWDLDGSFYEAGFAVMRTGLDEEAMLVVIQGEHGKVKSHGEGHEHPDPTSFLVHAFGEYLIIDPGYINWDNHEKVMVGKDHNLILVDGKGPPVYFKEIVPTDAFLSGFDPGPWATRVTVKSDYEDASIERRIVRIGGKYLIVDDRMESAKPHKYTWQLNGNGGGNTKGGSFELLQNGAAWKRTKASVSVFAASCEGTPAYGSRLEEHAVGGGWEMHEMFTVDAG